MVLVYRSVKGSDLTPAEADENISQLDANKAALNGTPAQAFSTAALTVAGLADISGASAGQVKFPATQNPSANANTLDDYKEGTWTPTPVNFTVVGAPTYAGTYTKIGRLVFGAITINGAGTSTASTTNSSHFTGFPYAPAPPVPCVAVSGITNASYGVGSITVSGVWTPTWAADSGVIISFVIFV